MRRCTQVEKVRVVSEEKRHLEALRVREFFDNATRRWQRAFAGPPNRMKI